MSSVVLAVPSLALQRRRESTRILFPWVLPLALPSLLVHLLRVCVWLPQWCQGTRRGARRPRGALHRPRQAAVVQLLRRRPSIPQEEHGACVPASSLLPFEAPSESSMFSVRAQRLLGKRVSACFSWGIYSSLPPHVSLYSGQRLHPPRTPASSCIGLASLPPPCRNVCCSQVMMNNPLAAAMAAKFGSADGGAPAPHGTASPSAASTVTSPEREGLTGRLGAFFGLKVRVQCPPPCAMRSPLTLSSHPLPSANHLLSVLPLFPPALHGYFALCLFIVVTPHIYRIPLAVFRSRLPPPPSCPSWPSNSPVYLLDSW
jgi:hypothetical protein